MTTNHLLSTSLFTELFQHNLVSPNGRIIASPKELEDYYQFLVRQSKDRVAMLYAERKKILDAVQKLLDIDNPTDQQTKLLNRLLKELDLKLEEHGELTAKEWTRPRKKYLGPKEPKMSLFELEIEAELKHMKMLKRDLRILDEWLSEISNVRPISDHLGPSDPKKAGDKLDRKVKNRMLEMEKARAKLIRQFYTDYDRYLDRVIRPKSRLLSDMNNTSKSNAVGEESPSTDKVKSKDTVAMKREPKNSSESDVDSDQSTDVKSEDTVAMKQEPNNSSESDVDSDQSTDVKSKDTVAMKREPNNSRESDVDSDQSIDILKSEDTVVMKQEPKNSRESDVDSDYNTDNVKSEDTVVMKPEPKNSSESDVDSDYSTDSVKSEDTVVMKPEPKNSSESDVDSDYNRKQGG